MYEYIYLWIKSKLSKVFVRKNFSDAYYFLIFCSRWLVSAAQELHKCAGLIKLTGFQSRTESFVFVAFHLSLRGQLCQSLMLLYGVQ
jgi:hypothetical protein